MYNGEAFIVRNAASKKLKNIIIQLAKECDRTKTIVPQNA